MTDVRELAQDLRAHAHEVPAHIGKIMRDAALVFDRYKNLLATAEAGEEAAVRPVPIPPPPLAGKHRRPS
jgi:hypothetical protein